MREQFRQTHEHTQTHTYIHTHTHSHKQIHSSRPRLTHIMKWCSLRSPDPLYHHSTVCWGYSEDQSHSNANHNSPLQSLGQQSWTRGNAAPWALSGGQHQSDYISVRMHCLHMCVMWSRVIAIGDMVRLSGRVCAGFQAVWWVRVISLARWFPHHRISCSIVASPCVVCKVTFDDNVR